MPVRPISILVRVHNMEAINIIDFDHEVRCPGCGNTTFLTPKPLGITYDIVCLRCRTPYLLQELTFDFRRRP